MKPEKAESFARERPKQPQLPPSPKPGVTAQKERAGFFAGPTTISDKEGASHRARGAFSVSITATAVLQFKSRGIEIDKSRAIDRQVNLFVRCIDDARGREMTAQRYKEHS